MRPLNPINQEDTGGDNVTDIERLQVTLESSRVRRFHATPSVDIQTIAQHVSGVCYILVYLYGGQEKVPAHMLLAALSHDQEELFTGDIPFHAKRDAPAMRTLCSELEELYNPCFLIRGLQLTERECFMLKLADQLEGLFWTAFHERGSNIHYAWQASLDQLVLHQFMTTDLELRVKDFREHYTLPRNA